MKKVFWLLMFSISAIILCLMACSQQSSPADVAEKFTSALAQGDLETAKLYMVEEAIPLLELAVSMGQMEVQEDFSFELIQQTVDGELAVVTYKSGKEKPSDIHLRKVEEEWRVYIEK